MLKQNEVLGRRRKSNHARNDLLWTKQQAADFLGMTVRTLESRMKQGLLPYFKISRFVRLRRKDVLEHLSSHNKVG